MPLTDRTSLVSWTVCASVVSLSITVSVPVNCPMLEPAVTAIVQTDCPSSTKPQLFVWVQFDELRMIAPIERDVVPLLVRVTVRMSLAAKN